MKTVIAYFILLLAAIAARAEFPTTSKWLALLDSLEPTVTRTIPGEARNPAMWDRWCEDHRNTFRELSASDTFRWSWEDRYVCGEPNEAARRKCWELPWRFEGSLDEHRNADSTRPFQDTYFVKEHTIPETLGYTTFQKGQCGLITWRTPGGEEFQRATLADAMDSLRNTRGLVLDLSGCCGGDLRAAYDVAGRFVGHDVPGVRARMEREGEIVFSDKGSVRPTGSWQYTQPLVVIVNNCFAGSVIAAILSARGATIFTGNALEQKTELLPGEVALYDTVRIPLPCDLTALIPTSVLYHPTAQTPIQMSKSIWRDNFGCGTADIWHAQRDWEQDIASAKEALVVLVSR